jgi:hypothetical protein
VKHDELRDALPGASAPNPSPAAPASDGASPEFLAEDEALAALELALARDEASQQAIVALAWQLRQRDPARALVLADAAEARLGGSSTPTQRGLVARLQLVRAEDDWLAGRLDAAASRTNDALQAFSALADAAGRADAHWVRAMIAIDRGDWRTQGAELQAMAEAARGRRVARGHRRGCPGLLLGVPRFVGCARALGSALRVGAGGAVHGRGLLGRGFPGRLRASRQ